MTSVASLSTYRRALDAKPNSESIIKPGELVDVVEMTPLTLTDRRIYNLLLAHAWDTIDQPGKHEILKRDLQGTLHKGSERLGDSLERLMSAVVRVRTLRNGKWGTERVQLLGRNFEPDAEDGIVRYEFSDRLRQIIGESTIFARLHREIMFALSSKYSLALYEMIQKRGNLNRSSENFTIEELRGLLGVPKDKQGSWKLGTWINLKNKAIMPAITEVSDLSDFVVSMTPIKGPSKQFSGVTLTWVRKETGELKKIERELGFASTGRRERMSGKAEKPVFAMASGLILRTDTFEKAKKLFAGYDVYFIEREWRVWAAGKEPPQSADAAFLAFGKKWTERNPL